MRTALLIPMIVGSFLFTLVAVMLLALALTCGSSCEDGLPAWEAALVLATAVASDVILMFLFSAEDSHRRHLNDARRVVQRRSAFAWVRVALVIAVGRLVVVPLAVVPVWLSSDGPGGLFVIVITVIDGLVILPMAVWSYATISPARAPAGPARAAAANPAQLLAPRGRVDLRVADGVGDGAVETGQLLKDLDALRAQLGRFVAKLPADVGHRTDDIMTTLRGILDRGEALSVMPDALFTVGRVIRDYLPTSLEAYLNLPRDYALRSRIAGRRSAHEELTSQLDLLRTEVNAIQDALFANDVQALRNQSIFLNERFRRSELDIDRHPELE